MNQYNQVYIGILLVVIGVIYIFWNINKTDRNNSDWLKKVDSVNSWVIALVLIGVGIILIF